MKNYLRIYDNGDSAVRITDLEECTDLDSFDLVSDKVSICCPIHPDYQMHHNTGITNLTDLFGYLFEHMFDTQAAFGKDGGLDIHGQEFSDEMYVDEKNPEIYHFGDKELNLNEADPAVKMAAIRAAFDDGYLTDNGKLHVLMNSRFDIAVVPLVASIHSGVSVRPYKIGGRLFGFAWSEHLSADEVESEVKIYDDFQNGLYNEVIVKSISLKDGKISKDEYCTYYRTCDDIWDTLDFGTENVADEISDALFEALKVKIEKHHMRSILQNGELEV